MRRQHVIQRTGKKEFPKVVICVQAKVRQRYESDADETGNLRLCGWFACGGLVIGSRVDWRYEGHGSDTQSWWDWCETAVAGLPTVHIYSWQARDCVAALDLWGRIERGEATLSGADPFTKADDDGSGKTRGNGFVILEGPPTIVCWRNAGENTVFVWLDPANYGASQLATSDNADGIYVIGNQHDGQATVRDAASCKRLVHSVQDWLESYWLAITELDMGGPEHTAASQAMQGFRHRYMKDYIHVHSSAPILSMERDALYGGRCECRFIGDIYAGVEPGELYGWDRPLHPVRQNVGPIAHLDVNSMYTAVAGESCIPSRFMGLHRGVSTDNLLAACKAIGVVANVTITTDHPTVPVRMPDRILWPFGTFTTTLCGPEILLAAEYGAKIVCHGAALYEMRPLFRVWVDTLYAAKGDAMLHNDKALASCIKALLNSLYGKFAQQSRRWIDVPDRVPPYPYFQWFQSVEGQARPDSYRSLGWQCQKLVTVGETNESCPVITAYINSMGRVRLWRLIQCAGEDNVYYYDTDSLFVSPTGLRRLQEDGECDPAALGKLKVVGTHQHVRINGRQSYEVDGKLVLSGYNTPTRKVGDATVETLKCPPINHYLLQGKPPGLERHIAKVRISRGYNLGHVELDGTVTPVRFSPEKMAD